MATKVVVIGGGLAGTEAAFKLLDAGFQVEMFEMRPKRLTGAHESGGLAELVCSNSLKSTSPETASGLLKEELDMLGSRLLPLARESAVPSGSALAVDRVAFSTAVERELAKYEGFTLHKDTEVTCLEEGVPTIIATGPLTSPDFADYLAKLTGQDRLFFYDAIAPIVSFDSVDMTKAYFGGRYGKGGDDYLNLPMQKEEYEVFYNALVTAETVHLHDFEKKELFDGCMPIEIMAKRGSDTMRYGPMRPVGLRNPNTGESAYAVVQLRKENVAGDCYNLVGFQTNLTYGEQKRVFSMIPAIHSAEFLRYGTMHRNTFIKSPDLLTNRFRLKNSTTPVYIAGQISGVEGYVESIMSGLIAADAMVRELTGKDELKLPATTITGALTEYVSSCASDFQPMNANFGLLPELHTVHKKQRKQAYHDRAIKDLGEFLSKEN
ncbi:MAG: methylenetetrahydrofolate--tRNA-(uracil(54)-C(5))-methyltransferase (FADH(2)-oxidizing) TrmFO [Clostridia bacterium]|nr:methylenetetrahydrofolate--tRNA-(uracil(54)-C(5))-methyltransferase (FADH(2)-oxidizing) TrmFO [Clostridia bacterium]